MGGWDEYCMVCGGPPSAPSFDPDNLEGGEPLPPPAPNPADYTWLGSLLGISNKEELIPLTSYYDAGTFDIQPDTSPYAHFWVDCLYKDCIYEDVALGYACHVTCYNLLQQELNYTLKHADVLPLLDDRESNFNTFSWSDYGGLAAYHEQYSDGMDVQLVKDGKLWMMEDPSRDAQNKERILQLWRPLVESGFKKLGARVGDGSKAPELAETNTDESKAFSGLTIDGL